MSKVWCRALYVRNKRIDDDVTALCRRLYVHVIGARKLPVCPLNCIETFFRGKSRDERCDAGPLAFISQRDVCEAGLYRQKAPTTLMLSHNLHRHTIGKQ